MKKKLKLKISAVMLSIVLALTMVATPSIFTVRDVSAEQDTQSQKIFNNWTMAAMIANKPKEYFNEKEMPDLQTAVIYTVLQYGVQANTNKEIDVEEFCSKVNDNFAGITDFKESQLEALDTQGAYIYDKANHKIIIPGGGAGDGLICTYLGQNREDKITKYGKWINFADPSEDPYYIALDVDDENKIIAYRSIDASKVSANLEIYHSGWNDDNDYIDRDTSYMKDDNGTTKAYLPYDASYHVGYCIKIEDGKDPVEFNEEDLGEDALTIEFSSQNKNILEKDADDETRVTAYDDKGSTVLDYQLKSNDNPIFEGQLPCTVYNLSIANYYGVCLQPGESRQLSVKVEGMDQNQLTYEWSGDCKINNVSGNTCQITAPSETIGWEDNKNIAVTAYINDGKIKIGTKKESIRVANCDLSIIYAKGGQNPSIDAGGDTLKVGQTYTITLNGADFGWDYGNGESNSRQTFYTLDFNLNGESITATEKEENLSMKDNKMTIGIGAGGGYPNRIIKVNQSGTLTITGKIYRDGKLFRETAARTFKVEGNEVNPSEPTKPSEPTTPSQPATTTSTKKPTQPTVSVKTTKLKSAKNAKGKKLVVKWKKNTAGNGYQIQYSTSKKFAKGNKTKTISKNKTTSYTIKKLKKKKTYYVRIRTYKKVSGKTYYSGWSSVKKVKINK